MTPKKSAAKSVKSPAIASSNAPAPIAGAAPVPGSTVPFNLLDAVRSVLRGQGAPLTVEEELRALMAESDRSARPLYINVGFLKFMRLNEATKPSCDPPGKTSMPGPMPFSGIAWCLSNKIYTRSI